MRKLNCNVCAKRIRRSNWHENPGHHPARVARIAPEQKCVSVLTMLGIIIGVGSVIASVSITTGATKQVSDKVASLGQNVITVFSGNFTSGALRGGWAGAPTLTVDDTTAIKNEVANVAAVSPESPRPFTNHGEWIELEHADPGRVSGLSADPRLEHGRRAMFSDADVRSLAKVAVIGKTVVDQLFHQSRSGRPDAHHPQHPVQSGRRAGSQGFQTCLARIRTMW